jgi:hypothetical protein
MVLPALGIVELLCAIGLVATAAPLPEVMPAGKAGISPVGFGADWAAREAADGTTLVAGRTLRCCACTAEVAAKAHSRAAAMRVTAGMTGSFQAGEGRPDAGGLISCWRSGAQRPSRARRHRL